MTGYFNVLFSVFVLIGVCFFVYCLIIYLKTPQEKIPKNRTDSNWKAYYLVHTGKYVFFTIIGSWILGLTIIAIKWLSTNINIW